MDETTAVTETLTTLSLDASPLPALPFEIVVEILCRLPVKLLLQLRCLCKSLNTLISDPKFIRKHLRLSTPCHRLLLFCSSVSDVLSYPLHSSFSIVTDYATRHEYPFTFKEPFYCIFGSCDGMFCLEVNRSVILWNPTRRSLKLASGTLNWFSFDDYRIVSFDLVNESCRKLLPPTYSGEAVYSVTLDVLRDCLCIFAHSYTSSTVWMMKEYGNEESWTQLFRVPRSEESFYDIHTRPIWISKDDQVLMKKKMNLAICDFKNGAFKIQMIQNIDDWLSPEVYIESLVSPCF